MAKTSKRIDLSKPPATRAAEMSAAQDEQKDVVSAKFPSAPGAGFELPVPVSEAPKGLVIEEIKINESEAYTPGRVKYYAFNTVQEHFTLIVPQLGEADEESTALGFSAIKDVVIYMSKEYITAANLQHHTNAVKSGVNVMKKLPLEQLNTTPFAEMAMQHGMSASEAESFRPERLAALDEAQKSVTATSNSQAMMGA